MGWVANVSCWPVLLSEGPQGHASQSETARKRLHACWVWRGRAPSLSTHLSKCEHWYHQKRVPLSDGDELLSLLLYFNSGRSKWSPVKDSNINCMATIFLKQLPFLCWSWLCISMTTCMQYKKWLQRSNFWKLPDQILGPPPEMKERQFDSDLLLDIRAKQKQKNSLGGGAFILLLQLTCLLTRGGWTVLFTDQHLTWSKREKLLRDHSPATSREGSDLWPLRSRDLFNYHV